MFAEDSLLNNFRMTVAERDKLNGKQFEIRTEPVSVKFIIGDTIARGKFGIVKKLTDRDTKQEYAGKFVRRGDVHREANLLSEVSNHKYIISLETFYSSPKTEMVIVMELAIGGDIFEYCVGERKTFTEDESKNLTRQLAQALEFIHSKYIVHLDVKPQNILLSKDGSCKLADFGLSRKILPGEIVQEICGTPEYTAPEILDYNPITTAADIWSLGAVLYVMLTGCSPFAGDTIQETYLNVAQASLEFPEEDWCDRSKAAIDLIEALCVPQPKDRLNASQILEQKWLNKRDENNLEPITIRRRPRSRKDRTVESKQFVQNNQSGDSDSGVSLADENDSGNEQPKTELPRSASATPTPTSSTPPPTQNRTQMPTTQKAENPKRNISTHSITLRNPECSTTNPEKPDFFIRREQRRKIYLSRLNEANPV